MTICWWLVLKVKRALFFRLLDFLIENQRNPYHRKHICQSSNRHMNYEPSRQKVPFPRLETLAMK